MQITMREYLNKETKAQKMEELRKLAELNYNSVDTESRSLILEEAIKEIILEINNNEYIHSFSSTKRGSDNESSYLFALYTEVIEKEIIENLIPFFEGKFNIQDEILENGFVISDGSRFFSSINNPKIDLELGKTAYFQLGLKSLNNKIHDEFWEEIRAKISSLKPQKS